MAAEARADVRHGAPLWPLCLLSLSDAMADGPCPWPEFDAEVERWGVEVRELSREGLAALIECSTRERVLHP